MNGSTWVIQLDCFGLPDAASFRLSVYSSPSVKPATRPGESMLGCGMTPGSKFWSPASWEAVDAEPPRVTGPRSWARAPPSQPVRTTEDNTTGTDKARMPGSLTDPGTGSGCTGCSGCSSGSRPRADGSC